MRERVINAFNRVFNYPPSLVVRAPGRANLIGEHTDYNEGFVMPLAIDRALYVAAAPRDDSLVRVHTLDYGQQTVQFSMGQLHDTALPHWTRHIRGMWWLLGERGDPQPGADLVVGSDIPIGAGMSSSAAIGVAVVELALALNGQESLSQVEKALRAVEIEHRYMGVPCGVMDQIASAGGQAGAAMLLDCRTLAITPVILPRDASVLVLNTMKTRELAGSAYAERRRQCEEAAAILGIPALRDASPLTVDSARGALGHTRYRRARHVVAEDERTLQMASALADGDLQRAGALINASHASLRDDYEVSCVELDMLSGFARKHPGCFGARMMGGGFGGCVVALVQAGAAQDVIGHVQAGYSAALGVTPECYACIPASGSSIERLH